MGTKRGIAPRVAELVHSAPPGPLLDLFSGVCAIGSEVAPTRQVWCNDIQFFASSVARGFFASPGRPIPYERAAEIAREPYEENLAKLLKIYSKAFRAENRAMSSGDISKISDLESAMPYIARSKILEEERKRLSENPKKFPYKLFVITFSGTYFGVKQCAEIDSIKYAIDNLLKLKKVSKHEHEWMCLALCQAVCKVSTTTGHFAQYLHVKEQTLKRFCNQRRRSVWIEWLYALFELAPVSTPTWRSKNIVFREDANTLLKNLKRQEGIRPAVIYADPPYTADHYSRYYHIYETLILYDYPVSESRGRYRPDRFASPFSVKSKISEAMNELVSGCAALGSNLILSYPQNGLLNNARERISEISYLYFGRYPKVTEIDYKHSSLGASKGAEKNSVKELVFSVGLT